MILLIGGTSDAAPIALALAEQGLPVLISTATGITSAHATHPHICYRTGRFDRNALISLIQQEKITAIVDSSHPYAVNIKSLVYETAVELQIPYFGYERPSTIETSSNHIVLCKDHHEAAQRACTFGTSVLLTIGSRFVHVYSAVSRLLTVKLVARVLDDEESTAACISAGIQSECIISGRGPYSIEQNREHIRQFSCDVLVTKDSGIAGGMSEKIAAANQENCTVVVIKRPPRLTTEVFDTKEKLITAVVGTL